MKIHTDGVRGIAVVVMIVGNIWCSKSASCKEPSVDSDFANGTRMVIFGSDEGRKLLQSAAYSESFWQMAPFHMCQPDLSSCGVASSCAVLNSLRCERPPSGSLGRHRLFTPENFFSLEVSAIITREKVSRSGMTLQQLGKLLAVLSVDVETTHASESTVDEFRKQLKQSLASKSQRVIVNYARQGVGQEGGGHISPLGAYNERDDMVLVLDTAIYKYPWMWVSVRKMWSAMSEHVDRESGRSRGFIVVTERK
jgi:hypothetical protein